MTWETGRPIHNRLPLESGDWQGNKVVDWLTGFWDDMLVSHQTHLSDPTDWLGDPETELAEYFLDWVGIGLCGYGSAWNMSWDVEIKRRLINVWVKILPNRSCQSACQVLVAAIVPGADVTTYDEPRADYARADVAWVGNELPMLYHINAPQHLRRNSKEWYWLEEVMTNLMPVGSMQSRVQYQVAMADYAVAGDAVMESRSYQYQTTN